LRNLIDNLIDEPLEAAPIYSVFNASSAWLDQVNQLKANGHTVIRAYQDSDIPAGANQLIAQGADWVIKIKE
jgi:ATP phosphoribosyltransferase regulatory subunit